ncbi:MAG TPA: hypothetical protein VG502_06590 [Flexivirga sp.]|uniref:hypothetical protein n=1 Tax=Flexivirga sp. TaxID=1962927 RepID=UPI002CF530E1|nr:hypothetical protein [Flexivirga sp.]HWC21951.1 hypothetical protein [Flexivirga sp.]
MSRTVRQLGLASAAVGTATAIAVATASGASAEPVWTLHHSARISTYVAKPGKTVTFTGLQTTKVDLGAYKNNVSAALDLKPGTMKVDLPIIPGKLSVPSVATATMQIEPVGNATGNFDSGKVDVTQRFNVRITKLSPLNIGIISLVPKTCMTSTPASMHLTGRMTGLFDPFTLKGSYSLPSFKNCGLLTSLVTQLTSGGGNTVSATFTPSA